MTDTEWQDWPVTRYSWTPSGWNLVPMNKDGEKMPSEAVKRLKATPHGQAVFASVDQRLKAQGRENAVGMTLADFAKVVFAAIDDADRTAGTEKKANG